MVTQANNQVMINNIKLSSDVNTTALHVYTGVFSEVNIPVEMVYITRTIGHILRMYEQLTQFSPENNLQ